LLKRCVFLLLIGLLQFASVLRPVALYAADLSAPVVRLSLDLDSYEEGMPISVSAVVTDNQRLKQVVLRFRLSGVSDEFLFIPMKKDEASRLYSASIPAAKVMAPGVEYFVEATDAEGNISQQPFPSHPHTVMIEGERSMTASRKINWWWVLAGVVAVGAVADGSGSSGGSENGEGSGGLTVVAPTP
jgi:hypothetical protein